MAKQTPRFEWNPGGFEKLEVEINRVQIGAAAEDIRRSIKSVAPVGKGRPAGKGKVPGWYKASIYADMSKDGKSWRVFSADVFSFLTEFGSRKNRPYRPFWIGIAKAGYETSSGVKVAGTRRARMGVTI